MGRLVQAIIIDIIKNLGSIFLDRVALLGSLGQIATHVREDCCHQLRLVLPYAKSLLRVPLKHIYRNHVLLIN